MATDVNAGYASATAYTAREQEILNEYSGGEFPRVVAGQLVRNPNELEVLKSNVESAARSRGESFKDAYYNKKEATLVTAPTSTTPSSSPPVYTTKEVLFDSSTGSYSGKGSQVFANEIDKAIYGSGSTLSAGFVNNNTQRSSVSQEVSSQANYENVKGEQFAVKNISGVDLFSQQNRSTISSGISAGLYATAGDVISGKTNPVVSSEYGMSTSNGLVPFSIARSSVASSSVERTGVGRLAFDLEVASNKNAVLAEGARNSGNRFGELKFTTLSALEGYGAVGFSTAGELKNQGSAFVGGVVVGGVIRGGEILLTRTLPSVVAKPIIVGGGAILGGVYASEKYNQFDASLKGSSTPLMATGGFLAQTGAEIGGFGVGAKIASGVGQNIGVARFETARTSPIKVSGKTDFVYEVKSANVNPPMMSGELKFGYKEQFKGVVSRVRYGEVSTVLTQKRSGDVLRVQKADGIRIVTEEPLGGKATTTVTYGGDVKSFGADSIVPTGGVLLSRDSVTQRYPSNKVESGILEQDIARRSLSSVKRGDLQGSYVSREGLSTTTFSQDTAFYRVDNTVLRDNRGSAVASGSARSSLIGVRGNDLRVGSKNIVRGQSFLKSAQTGFIFTGDSSGVNRNIVGSTGVPVTSGRYQNLVIGEFRGGESSFFVTKDSLRLGRRGQLSVASDVTLLNDRGVVRVEKSSLGDVRDVGFSPAFSRKTSFSPFFGVSQNGMKSTGRSQSNAYGVVSVTKPDVVSVTDVRFGQLQGSSSLTKVGVVSVTKPGLSTLQENRVLSDYRTPGRFGIISTSIQTPVPTTDIPLGFPSVYGYNPSTRSGDSRGLKRKYRYAPSVTALAFNIRGKKEGKNLTGLEVRPIVRL